MTGEGVRYAPYQEVSALVRRIPIEDFQEAVRLIETDGAVYGGAEAVFRTLAHAPGHAGWLWLYRRAPGFAPCAEGFYRLVADNRTFFSRLTRWLVGDNLEPATYFISRWLFLRLLGIVYLCAFVSIWTQIEGLIGSRGILPAADFLRAVASQAGGQRFYLVPTVFWLGAGDGALKLVCGLGTATALLIAAGILEAPGLAAAWVLYLSLTSVGGEFLSFQWDALLLETGFLAIFLAPIGLWSRRSKEPPPSPAVWRLARWLLFRLMFQSGCVKLLSGDQAWRSLTALRYHYWSQPIPNRICWFANLTPAWFQTFSCAAVLGIELLVPFLIVFPRRPRLLAFFALVSLQAVIAATGNYGFFNLLAAALCVPLLDDAFLAGIAPARLRPKALERAAPRPGRWLAIPLSACVLALSVVPLWSMLIGRRLPGPLASFWRLAQPFRLVNNYGLFAVMTTKRPEIVIEGSRDGRDWRAYEFRWKPGDLKRPPPFVAPHMPRLDWQMWFAALSDYRNERWFAAFLARLLEGSPPVLALLKTNPFPDVPPRYLRAVLYEYNFTDRTQRRSSGAWWRREEKGLYCPIAALR